MSIELYEADVIPLELQQSVTIDLTIEKDYEKFVSHTQLTNIGTYTHAQIDAHIDNVSNPHSVTKTQVGLGNVDNTSDVNKPVSTAQAAAIAVVQSDVDAHEADAANPHNVTKTQVSLGNVDNTSDMDKPVSTAQAASIATKVDKNSSIVGATKTKITYDSKGLVTAGADLDAADLPTGIDASRIANGSVTSTEFQYLDGVTASIQNQINGKEFSITPTSSADYYRGDKTFQPLNKTAVGLSNVDNTSDANKPVSTATQTALNLKENSANKGVANGYASLNGVGQVPASQIPTTLFTYLGAWNASTNTPTLINGTGTVKDQYIVNVAGTQNLGSGPLTFALGDFVIYNGAQWEQIPNTDAVTSVAGKIGAVTLVKADVGLGNVDNTSDANKPVSTATQTALNLKEDLTNKATNFSVLNNTLYPTTQAVSDKIVSSLTGLSPFFFYNTASDIATYKKMLTNVSTGGLQTISITGVTNNQLLAVFATEPNYPNLTYIPVGTILFHIHANKPTGTKTVNLYALIYKRTSGGVETLLATTSNTAAIASGGSAEYTTDSSISTAQILNATDRIVIKIYAAVSGGGSTPDIDLGIEDNTVSRMALPVPVLTTGIDAVNISTGVVSNTEFNYLDGVTSPIQTQINTKATITQAAAYAYYLG